MKPETGIDQDQLWCRLVRSNTDFALAWQEFFSDGADRVSLIRKGLFLPHGEDRATGLRLLERMDVSEQLQLFPELINLARAVHGPVGFIWGLILSLPRDWVLTHIEPEVDAILRNEEEDDYWMFLQLYEQLDAGLALKLARRAASHVNPDIRELGEDSLQRLGQPKVPGDGQPLPN